LARAHEAQDSETKQGGKGEVAENQKKGGKQEEIETIDSSRGTDVSKVGRSGPINVDHASYSMEILVAK